MLKHLQKLLLIAALCVPWVTQAQCTSGLSCPIVITMYGDYDDSWSYYGDINLGVYQNGSLIATVDGDGATQVVENVSICAGDSVYVVVTSWQSDDSECSFEIANGDGTVVLTESYISSFSLGDTVARFEGSCPSCPAPSNLVTSVNGDEITLSWTPGGDESSWIVSDDTNSYVATDTFYTFQNLYYNTMYHLSVRALCSSTDTSSAADTHVASGCDPNGCSFSIAMHDSWGDGWNGNAINGYINGTLVFTATIASGSDNVYTGCMGETDTLVLSWIEGSYSDEASFQVAFGGAVLFSGEGSSLTDSATFFTLAGCPSCLPPSGLTLDSVTTSEAFVHWTAEGDETSWVVWINDSIVDDATDTTYYFSELSANTIYSIKVAALCDNGDTSLVVGPIQVRTLAGLPISEFPYSCGFEINEDGDDEASDWVFENGTQTNYWMVGTSTNNGGSKALYITNDSATNAYSTGSTSYSFAYATFQFVAGEYAYSYNWKAYGESSYDFIRAAVVPNTTEFTAGSYNGFNNTSSVPTGGIAIDGANRLNLQNSWQTQSGTFTIPADGLYKVVFMWRNDGSGGSQPPAAIDNISIIRNTCPAPTNFAYDTVGGVITLTWTDNSGSNWEVVYGPQGINPGTADNVETSTSTTLQLTGLTQGFYDAYVRTDCGDDDYSAWVGPLSISVGITIMNMNAGNDTLYSCAATIYDDGGPNASYSSSREDLLVVYPDQPNHGFLVTGSAYTESTWDYLRIYDGVGTSGTMLFNDYGVSNLQQIGPFMTDGPVTITFHSDGSVNYSGFEINLACQALSTCATPTQVRMTEVSNDHATVAWVDTSNSWNSTTILWGTGSDISQATDSATVAAGVNSYTITGLTGTTSYNVWVRGDCSSESSRAIQVGFTTTVDCAPVLNLAVSSVDYHAFGLQWDAPVTGYSATEYIVSWKHANASAWTSDTTTNTFYYISGLGLDSTYQYRVTTICNTQVSDATSGSVQTLGCGYTIGDGASTYSYLPTYTYYDYCYTQQIYLDNELTGVDSIASISFYTTGSPSRTIRLFMGNTTQSSFSSTSNYIPVANLDTVYEGSLSGTGWITLNLTHPFVRTAGSNLVVATDDNSGTWVSAPSWKVNSAPNRAFYFYQDGTDIDPTAPSAGSSSVVNYVNQIRLVPPTCVIPDCATPVVMIDSVGQHEVSIVFNTEPGVTYEVAYQAVGDNTWTIAETANTTGSCTISGLSAAVNYTVRVSMDCNGTTLTGSISFWTLCGPADLPVTENFESVNYGYFSRQCWTTGSTNVASVSYPNCYVISLTGDPNKLCLFHGGAYMILPQMNAPLNELQARFTLVQGGDSVRFLIGLIDDPTLPISTMTVLDTLMRSDYDTTSSTAQITYSFANIDPADSAKHIAFWDAFSDNYTFIDNLVIEYIPACSPVTDLAVSNVTSTTADVSWTSTNTNASGYIIEYGPHGFTPGDATVNTVVAATASPTTLTGLNHSTNYDVYVYTACTTLGDTSIAAGPAAFTTTCGALTTLPYFMNFENIMPAGTGSSNTSYLPNCWTVSSTGTVPHIYYTTATAYAPSQAYALRVVNDGYLVLNEMGVPLNTLMLSFHDYNFSPSDYRIIVGAVDNNASGFESTFTPIDTLPLASYPNESMQASYLVDYTGTANYIALKFEGNSGTGTAHYIDNLTIDVAPSCIAPQRVHAVNLTNTVCDIVWSTSQATNYSIEYGLHGFTPGTGTTMTTTTRAASFTGLTPNTQYDGYIVGVCSATEHSDTTFFTFNTLIAAPATVPYLCDFEQPDVNGWELINGTQSNYWMVGAIDANNRALFITNDSVNNSYSGSEATVFASRVLNLAQAGEYAFSFDWMCQGESSWDYLRAALVPVGTELTPGNLSGFDNSSAMPTGGIAIDGGYRMNSNSSWATQEGTFNLTQPGSYRMVFMWRNDNSVYYQPPAAIDNVSLALNVCPISNLAASNVTGSTATVSWSSNSNSYEVEYGTAGFTIGTGTAQTTTDTTVALAGLSSLTSYDVYVRGFCGTNDTSRWYKVRFSTAMCDNPSVAFAYDTAIATPGSSSNAPIGYSYYNYSYTQTIIDAARMADLSGDISAFTFTPASTSAGSYFTHMDVYMANVSESDLTSGFIYPDDSTHVFVQVISDGNFNFDNDTVQFHAFDTPFTWDGQSNVLFVVNRRHGSWTSGSSFVTYSDSTTTGKTRYVSSDGSVYNPATVSGGSVGDFVGDMMFFSCAAGCSRPSGLYASNIDYQGASLNWTSSSATDFEVAVKAVTDASWPAEVSVSNALSYAVTGLSAATRYQFRVRAICDATEGLISDWTMGSFVTDSLPCFDPSNLQASATGYTTATLAWDADASQNLWEIHVWNSSFDTSYSATGNPFTVTGLAAKTGYSAAVKAICGNGAAESEYSNTIQFTTDSCAKVTGVTVSGTTASSTTVSWTPTGASKYIVEYGDYHFNTGDGTSVTVENATSYTITGLRANYDYSVAVKAVCEEGVEGNWSTPFDFTTLAGDGVNTVDGGMSLTIYPNPTSDATTIALSGVNGEVSITIVDMNGRTVKTGTMSCEGDCTKRMDVSGLAQGAYFVRVSGEGVNQVKKLVVK